MSEEDSERDDELRRSMRDCWGRDAGTRHEYSLCGEWLAIWCGLKMDMTIGVDISCFIAEEITLFRSFAMMGTHEEEGRAQCYAL